MVRQNDVKILSVMMSSVMFDVCQNSNLITWHIDACAYNVKTIMHLDMTQ